jgi:ABC-2 type transport system ATP-binding protein
MSPPIIQTDQLTVYYGNQRGVVDLDLSVNQGEVYGFLGPNGAGKTTTQRVLLDILRPTKGSASMFGLDCQKDGVAIRTRVGYLPGELSLYPNMTARGFLDMAASVSGGDVDQDYRRSLIDRLQLDPNRRMREYSRGNKQKVGVVAAFMRRPDLLILDEPTSGLDPLVQAAVLELVREAKTEGRTVFFSSHIISEVQAVCDRVGIIREGRLVATESVETLIRQQFRRLRLTFPDSPPAFELDGVTETARDDRTVILEIRENFHPVLEKAVSAGVADLETIPVSLEEVFRAYYGGGGGNHG